MAGRVVRVRGTARGWSDKRSSEPDNQQHPLKNASPSTSAAADGSSNNAVSPTSIRVQSAEERAEEKRMKQEEEERQKKKKEEEDEDKEPCCTRKCACLPFLGFAYFLLGIFMFVGLIVSFVFMILHFVFRLLHFMFWGMAKMREAASDVLDTERLQLEHEKAYKAEMQEWEHNQKIQATNKEREAAERKRLGKKPKKDDSDDDIPAPSPHMRICGPACAMKSGVACLGMSFNGMAYLWFVLAFMFGFSSISIFTSIFPSCSVRGVTYLAGFRRDYDMDLIKVAADKAAAAAEAEKK